MEGLLKGKKAIVTGARGLARGMVQGLFDAGAQIAVGDGMYKSVCRKHFNALYHGKDKQR